MNNASLLFIVFCLIGGLSLSVDGKEKKLMRDKQSNCQLISSRDAMNRAQAITKGKIVSVKLNRKDKKSVYRVRILVAEKRIKNLTIAACK